MSNPKVRQHDPLNIVFTFGGLAASGFLEGTFVECERYADAMSMNIGSDGEGTRVKSQNRSGYFKLSLKQDSPFNDYLTSLANQDENTSDAVKAAGLTDKNGTTIGKASKCWIKKKSKVVFSNGVEGREWTFDTHNLTLDVGGQNEL
jgi:hypothetical protein